MSQVVSRNLRGDPSPRDGSSNSFSTNRRERLLIVFHGAAASTYGFAICWQNVSQASAQLFLRTNPLMRTFSLWRFLTYNCLVMQFAAYALCFTSHFVPKLRRPRDYFFTTLAFPTGMIVVGGFWAIWFVAGRKYIFPASLEAFYPPWLNHVTHTIIAPINLVELLLVRKQYPSDRRGITTLVGYTASYTSFLLYIRLRTGRWVYPFLNKMDSIPIGAFIVGTLVFGVIIYKSGKLLHDFVHGVKLAKARLTGSEPSSSSNKKN